MAPPALRVTLGGVRSGVESGDFGGVRVGEGLLPDPLLCGHVEPGDAGEVVAHEGGPAAQDPDLVLVEKQLVAIPSAGIIIGGNSGKRAWSEIGFTNLEGMPRSKSP